jgi:hypothetical protein
VGGRVKRGLYEVNIEDDLEQVEHGSSGGPVIRTETNELIGIVAGVGESGYNAYIIPAIRLTRLFNGPMTKGSIEWRVNFLRVDVLGGLSQDIRRASESGFRADECTGVQAAISRLFNLTDHIGSATFWSWYANRDLHIFLDKYVEWNALPSGQTPEVIQQRKEYAQRIHRIRRNLADQIRLNRRWLATEMDEPVLRDWFIGVKKLVDRYPITFKTVHTKLEQNWQLLA